MPLLAMRVFVLTACGSGRLPSPEQIALDFNCMGAEQQVYLEGVATIIARFPAPLADTTRFLAVAKSESLVWRDPEWQAEVTAARTEIRLAGTQLRRLDDPGRVSLTVGLVDDLLGEIDWLGQVNDDGWNFSERSRTRELIERLVADEGQEYTKLLRRLSQYCDEDS